MKSIISFVLYIDFFLCTVHAIHYTSRNLLFEENRMYLLKVRFVFELYVQCLIFSLLFFNNVVVDGVKFKIPWLGKKTTTSISVPVALPESELLSFSSSSLSQASGLQRRTQLSASLHSLTEIGLHAKPSSSSSISMLSLNKGNSPAMMFESKSLHKQAASSLNTPHQLLSETIGKQHNYRDQLQKFGVIFKNVGIGLGAVGGMIQIGQTLSKDENVNESIIISNSTTTTAPETSTSEIKVRLPK